MVIQPFFGQNQWNIGLSNWSSDSLFGYPECKTATEWFLVVFSSTDSGSHSEYKGFQYVVDNDDC